MSEARQIIVLCGGLSSEREVSLRSGQAVAEVLPGARLVEQEIALYLPQRRGPSWPGHLLELREREFGSTPN